MGAPGGGKGTISKKLKADFGVGHISTGDVLRAHVTSGSELGKAAKSYMDVGELVPDDLMVALALEEVNRKLQSCDHALLDGFPRTVAQAEALDAELTVDLALNLVVPTEEIVSRISSRWVHLLSGRVYAYDYNPPKVDGIDDDTGEPLMQRDDDTPDAVRKRLAGYTASTAPLVGYYQEKGVLSSSDGSTHPELVAADRRSDAIYAELKPIVAAAFSSYSAVYGSLPKVPVTDERAERRLTRIGTASLAALDLGSFVKGGDDESIRRAFEKIDTSNNGWLEKNEISAVMHEMKLHPKRADHLIASLPDNLQVDLETFTKLVRNEPLVTGT